MAIIDQAEAAKRLARVILSDIELYNLQKIEAGESLEAELEAGLALFRKRVTPELVPIFTEAVENNRRVGMVKAESPPAAASAPPAQDPVDAPVGALERPPATTDDAKTPAPLAVATSVATGQDVATPPRGTIVPDFRQDQATSRLEPPAPAVAPVVTPVPGRPFILPEKADLERDKEGSTPTPLPLSAVQSRRPASSTRLSPSVDETRTSRITAARIQIDPARAQNAEVTDLRPKRSKTRVVLAIAAIVLAAACIYRFL